MGSMKKHIFVLNFNIMEVFQMILTDEICDKLCAAAREKSKEIGIDISFAVSDENGFSNGNSDQ